jgi:tRNA threonylcarbamoyladenosine biosynthesis protein TsaE
LIKRITRSEKETEQLGEGLAGVVEAPAVIALFGGLGMGKTAFCRGFARGMNTEEQAHSPTFAIVNEYHGRVPVIHFDMYRIDGWDGLYSTGFFDYLGQSAVILIEWSENIVEFLPDDAVKIHIEYGDNECERIFTIDAPDKMLCEVKDICES